MAEKEDYEVGYGRPPRETRFRKGQSGNPKGRRQGSRGLRTDLHEELNTKLTLSIAGKQVKETTQRLMLRTLATRAASGNVQATRLLVDLTMQIFGSGDRGSDAQRLSAVDQELLDRYLGRLDAMEGHPGPVVGDGGSADASRAVGSDGQDGD